IRPQNLRLLRNGDLILLDCTFCCQADARQIPVENPSFSAPELRQGQATVKSDWYSIAATIFHIANGFPPNHRHKSEYHAGLRRIDVGVYYPPAFDHSKYDAVIEGTNGLFEALMNPDPSKRPESYWEIHLQDRTVLPSDHITGILDAGE